MTGWATAGGALITGGLAGTVAAGGGMRLGVVGTWALTSAPDWEASAAVAWARWLTAVWRVELVARWRTGVGAADCVTGGVASMVLAAAWTGVGAADGAAIGLTEGGADTVCAVVVWLDSVVVVCISEPLSPNTTAAPRPSIRTAATGIPIISAVLFERRCVRPESAGLPTIIGESVTELASVFIAASGSVV